VAGPVGRTAPWLWPFGGHLPSLEAGSGQLGLRDPGGESPPPWILLALALFLRSSTPRRFRYLPFRGGLLPVGESPRLRPSPALAPRPALRVEAPRVPVQAFGSHSQGDAPSDTTGHQVPRWEPEGTPIRLVSPSGASDLSPGPRGFPLEPARRHHDAVSPPYATAIIRVPQPVRPSRPEVPPLAGSYHASTPV
jgi:hypothetical protein